MLRGFRAQLSALNTCVEHTVEHTQAHTALQSMMLLQLSEQLKMATQTLVRTIKLDSLQLKAMPRPLSRSAAFGLQSGSDIILRLHAGRRAPRLCRPQARHGRQCL